MNIKTIFLIFKKELKELFRDKKAIFVSLVLPIFLFPFLFSLVNFNLNKNKEVITRDLKISLVPADKKLLEILKTDQSITIINSLEPKADLKQGKLNLVLTLKDTKELEILADNLSATSLLAKEKVLNLLQRNQSPIMRATDFNIYESYLVPHKLASQKNLLLLILPLMLLVYSATSSFAPAADLGAGEKERGTIEALLSSQAEKIDILIGKVSSVFLMGILGVSSLLLGFFLATKFFDSGLGFLEFELFKVISPLAMFIIACLTLLLIFFFSILELLISFFARSSKEAQAYFLPLIIVSVSAAYSTMNLDIKNISPYYLYVPLVNFSVLLKELIMDIYNPFHIALVVLSSLFLAFITGIFAYLLLKNEKVLFRSI